MPPYRYLVADVFTDVPFAGNQLAVFPDARGIEHSMQAVARELNLAETVFVLPAEREGIARLRIFTPGKEIEFAGHPTIGTAFVLTREGRAASDAFVLEENVGPVHVRIERRADPFLAWLWTPPIRFGGIADRARCAAALRVAPDALIADAPTELAGAGNPFVFVALREPADVDALRPDVAAVAELTAAHGANGIFVFAPQRGGVRSRMFAPLLGVIEDPATGGATGPLGAYLAKHGFIPLRHGERFVSEQGVALGRRSILHGLLHVRDGELQTVEVGGSAVHVAEGHMEIPPP